MRRSKQETISDFCYLLSINNVVIIVANSRDFYLSVLASFGLIIQVSSVGNAMQGFLVLQFTCVSHIHKRKHQYFQRFFVRYKDIRYRDYRNNDKLRFKNTNSIITFCGVTNSIIRGLIFIYTCPLYH